MFGRFGEVAGICLQGDAALVALADPVSAVFAARCLNGLLLPELRNWLVVQQLPPQDSPEEARPQLKFTCRFLIQIPNEREFQVARKIIGNRGTNMKKVIDSCARLVRAKENEVVKLRLRGRGSGYKEGPNQAESDDPLHLCISSKFEPAYHTACEMVESLLLSIYQDYDDFCRRTRKNPPCFRVQRMDGYSQGRSLLDIWADCFQGAISTPQVQELIEARNNARRSLNFAEADRIREFLRSRGIAVIDEKGGRGSAH